MNAGKLLLVTPMLVVIAMLALPSGAEPPPPTDAPPAVDAAGTRPAPVDHSTMDHSNMDHSKMDHSKMDHSTMDHSTMDHSKMDQSKTDHSTMDHSTMDHSTMDHSTMDHSGMAGMDHAGHSMTFDATGMVMNSNATELPQDCDSIRREYAFEVRAGTKYAKGYPGNIFGMSQHEFRVEPCSRIKITFINEDAIRHQFMVHNLPRYLYPQGMFHMEAAGGATQVGTLILPSDNRTYLVHCDIAQHMEKGMKGQIVAGGGSGDLTSIPGVTAQFRPDTYVDIRSQLLAIAAGIALVLAGFAGWRRWR